MGSKLLSIEKIICGVNKICVRLRLYSIWISSPVSVKKIGCDLGTGIKSV